MKTTNDQDRTNSEKFRKPSNLNFIFHFTNDIQSVLHLMCCDRGQCCLACWFVIVTLPFVPLAVVNAFQRSVVAFDNYGSPCSGVLMLTMVISIDFKVSIASCVLASRRMPLSRRKHTQWVCWFPKAPAQTEPVAMLHHPIC